MAKTDNLTDFLTGIADAIRAKKGTTAKINPQNFETEIKNISKPEQEKTVEATNSKQTILPDYGKTLSKVTVEAAPLPSVNNSTYENINKCLIDKKNKTLILGCNDSVIPSDGSVTSIGEDAFSDCDSLTNITIPDSVTSIGHNAFSYCSGLTSVTIGNSVISIGNSAFRYCGRLTSITFPNSVTSIGHEAFNSCSGLTSVTIPNSVTSIILNPFSDCSGIESLIVTTGNKKYHSANNCIIETETKKLIVGCKNSVIPSDGSVTSIDWEAFYGCRGLTSIVIPDSVTNIGAGTFYDCSGLTNITIPDSVTSIDINAFNSCSGLTSVTIGNGVTSIGSAAFQNCSGIESLVVTTGNKKYHSANNCIIETESKTLILGCKNSVIPSDGSVTSIGDIAFYGCDGLTSIVIPDTVTSIGRSAFGDCSGLTSIIIPNSVTFIGESVFWGCYGLTSVTIGNSVTSIGEDAFIYCSRLASVIMLPTNPPTLGSNAIPSNATTITVPAGCGDAYKTAADWSAYADKIVEATV